MSKRQMKDIQAALELGDALRKSGVYIEQCVHAGDFRNAAGWLNYIQPYLNKTRRPLKRLAGAQVRIRWRGLWPWHVGWRGFLCGLTSGLLIGMIGTSILLRLLAGH